MAWQQREVRQPSLRVILVIKHVGVAECRFYHAYAAHRSLVHPNNRRCKNFLPDQKNNCCEYAGICASISDCWEYHQNDCDYACDQSW